MKRLKKTVPIIFGILILTSSSGFQFAPTFVQTAEAESPKRIVGYFPWWESADIDSIDYSKVTEIIYFHIWPNPDGTLDTEHINYNINNLHTIRDRAHAANVNVLISVGGWGVSDAFSVMAEDPTSRASFVTNIENFLTTQNLDGVDIDWEPVDTETKKDNLALLLSDLSVALHPDGKLVTVAVNAERVELRASTVNSLSWVNVMAYDMNWDNAEHSTFNDSIAALDRYEKNGIPKEKLVLGIPFYGRSSEWSSEMKYEEIVSTCMPSSNENYCNGHYFNGIDLVQQKAQYVLDNGYDGVMIWNLGQDTYDQTSLLNAINGIFEEDPSDTPTPISIAITNPQEGEISGKVSILADVTEGFGGHVLFTIGNEEILDYDSPFQASIHTKNYSADTLIITADAVEGSITIDSDSVQVTIPSKGGDGKEKPGNGKGGGSKK